MPVGLFHDNPYRLIRIAGSHLVEVLRDRSEDVVVYTFSLKCDHHVTILVEAGDVGAVLLGDVEVRDHRDDVAVRVVSIRLLDIASPHLNGQDVKARFPEVARAVAVIDPLAIVLADDVAPLG